MYGIRRDGVAVKLPDVTYISKEEAASYARKYEYLAVSFDGMYVFGGANPFIKQMGNLRVLQSVPDNGVLFTDNDGKIRDIPFYIRGLFGINSKGEQYTRLHTAEFTSAAGNTYRIYLRGGDIALLLTNSPNSLSLNSIKEDTILLGSEIHGLGKSVGLIMTPTCTGYLNLIT